MMTCGHVQLNACSHLQLPRNGDPIHAIQACALPSMLYAHAYFLSRTLVALYDTDDTRVAYQMREFSSHLL